MLIPPAQSDPSSAIATDISLLKTRTVAERTISALRLNMRPDDLTRALTAYSPDSNQILQLTLSAPTDAEAVRRLGVLSQQYLNFRAAQLTKQSEVLIDGYDQQIRKLQAQAQTLRTQVVRLTTGDQTSDQLTEAVTKLSQINDQISNLQGTIDDQTLQQRALVTASRVIDPAADTPGPGRRRTILGFASGLIGGLALGFGVVVLRALLSDRLWLRMEVASGLNASVIASTGRVVPLSSFARIARWLPAVEKIDVRRTKERERLAGAIQKAIPEPPLRPCLAVLSLDNSDEVRFGVVAAALNMHTQGCVTTIVDLTGAGTVTSALAQISTAPADEMPTVFRPSVVPSRAKRPAGRHGGEDDLACVQSRTRAALILADFDPAVGLDHLNAWADAVVVAVTAGRSRVELVRTAGDLVRAAGLELRGTLLLKTEHGDTSSGIVTEQPSGHASEGVGLRPKPGVGRSSLP